LPRFARNDEELGAVAQAAAHFLLADLTSNRAWASGNPIHAGPVLRFVWFRTAVSILFPFPFLAAAVALVIGKP
jgi:hypothetical protein